MSSKKPKAIVLRAFMQKPTSRNQGWANLPKLLVPMGPGHIEWPIAPKLAERFAGKWVRIHIHAERKKDTERLEKQRRMC